MAETTKQLPENLNLYRVLPTAAAAELTGYAVEHWRQLHREGKTPPAIRLSARKYGWRLADLIAWQDSKKGRAA